MLRMARAQIISEYTLMISVIILAVVVMFPMVRRSTQKLTKLAADQIGNQVNADQDVNSDTGYLINSVGQGRSVAVDDDWYVYNATGHTYNDSTTMDTITYTNQGFTAFSSDEVTNSWFN